MDRKPAILFISVYKFSINFARIILGLFLFNFKCNIPNIQDYILGINEIPIFITRLIDKHVAHAPPPLTCLLASLIIILSAIELVFVTSFLLRRRWGAIGFLVISVLWIPVELLVVSQFLAVSKILAIIIDIIIIYFLYRVITHPHHYFKEQAKL